MTYVNSTWTILAQAKVYQYLAKRYPKLVRQGRLLKIDVCQSGKENGSGLNDGGSYHVLKRGFEMIQELHTRRHEILIVYVLPHRLHQARVQKQVRLFDKYAHVITDGPSRLYPTAAQWWCRNKWLWYFRELVGYIPLKLAGQI